MKRFAIIIMVLFSNLALAQDSKSSLMANSMAEMSSWDKYPTYAVYDSLMRSFANNYPDLCKLDTIGFSENNKLILSLIISDTSSHDKVRFFYSSTIHGDETVGVVLMLRLADYLLSSYETEDRVRKILSSTEVFINPIANPDGMYRLSDNTIEHSIRFNSNYVDLNRNFPSPRTGGNPDGNVYQKETLAFMDYAYRNNFDISANLHGGAEVINYPWDSWRPGLRTHPDEEWFESLAQEFIDSFPDNTPSGFFTDVSSTGFINGGDWYVIQGGRQDYYTYFHRCREVTMEISSQKILPSSLLGPYWNYLHEGLILYLESAQEGLRGYIRDSANNEPIQASVWIENHDDSSSFTLSRSSGFYYRPVIEGSYRLICSAEGYKTKHIDINYNKGDDMVLDISLSKSGTSIDDIRKEGFNLYPNPFFSYLIIEAEEAYSYSFYDAYGRLLESFRLSPGQNSLDMSHRASGVYFIEINGYTKLIIKE